MKRVWV